jgi:hypothetical protein
MTSDLTDKLVSIVEQRIAELEETLLTDLDIAVVTAVNELYELRNNLRWGGQVPPAEPQEITVDNAQLVIDTVNTVVKQLQRAKMYKE